MSGVALGVAAVSMGGQVFMQSAAKKAARSAQKKEAAIAAQYAKGEQRALIATTVQAQAQADRKRRIIYIVSGVAGLAIVGAIIYAITTKKKKWG